MIDTENRLKHIAFIMDGNGRWASSRSLSRSYGHKKGVEALERVAKYCAKIGIEYITVYAFSTENFKRPKEEVDYLLSLFKDYIDRCIKKANENDVRILIIGDKSILGEEYEKKAQMLEDMTKDKLSVLAIAFNYGGRRELAYAFNKLISEGKTSVSEEDIAKALYTHSMPDPDLIVRTAGEKRLSNFLMWQSAYSEFYFTDVLWPDFSEKDVDLAVKEYYSRKRNFGEIPK